VSAVHDGQTLAFRLQWKDPTEDRAVEDTTQFSDCAAVLLPVIPGAQLASMGAPGLGVNAWYWRADDNAGRHVVAEGIGTSRTLDTRLVSGRGTWKGGAWRAVIARSMRVDSTEPMAQVQSGQKTQFGVAIWEGSHGERGGIKAYSVDWRDLVIDPVPMARR
jgi:complex iron-sulfur molybdoenzyme family reductase subunit gamma